MMKPLSPGIRTGLGILVMLAWSLPWFLVAVVSLMGTLMANDSGAASSSAHLLLVAGVFAGFFLVGLAGIPAGLAFFLQGKSRVLLIAALGAVVLGALAVLGAYFNFAASARQEDSSFLRPSSHWLAAPV